MYETVKEVYKETITKGNITQLMWDNTTSLQFDNVEDICEIKNPLMIEAGVTKNNKQIKKFKDYSVYPLNIAIKICKTNLQKIYALK